MPRYWRLLWLIVQPWVYLSCVLAAQYASCRNAKRAESNYQSHKVTRYTNG